MLKTAAFFFAFSIAALAADTLQPVVDNERVTVYDVTWNKGQPNPLPHADHDFVAVSLTRKYTAAFKHQGDTPGVEGERTMIIELKDHPVPPLANKTSYPLAFPRPGSKKLIDNPRVTVWSYHWLPGKPTRMHFHDKDVLVVYMEDSTIKSTTPDGKATVSEYKFGQPKFNLRDRTHFELVEHGTASAVMTELK